ncbi:GH19594 [Drosophila grimshawi]|uniref:GH19594 n=1 Tax=Drosophila grimshawi TaxID=7222 RepID=B4JI05_DROGR|nr:GH19594 [Drosophila grimshawi]
MASEHEIPSVVQNAEHNGNSDTDSENIPYHARENALPFTYGNIPVGFNTSELNHVGDTSNHLEILDTKLGHNISSGSQSNNIVRKTARPSISASCPLVRKTPSRKEFEDMLMERKVQAIEANKDSARELLQDETIQRDLDELHRKLNRPLLAAKEVKDRQIESIDLPDVETRSLTKYKKPDLALEEKSRSKTPTFPYVQNIGNTDRCVSPYPVAKPFNNLMIDENGATTQQTKQNIQHFDNISNTKEVDPHLVKFAKDLSEFWYKPNMSREEAVDLLRDAVPGTFIIRNSTTYQNAFGLVLRVAKPPPGVVTGPGYGNQLVRHFLLEPTTRGVCLMGCVNEPIFTSLSAFVFEHSINQMSLPCTLILPDRDHLYVSNNEELINNQKQMLAQGAACNVLYLFQGDMESLTGDDAVRKAVFEMLTEHKRPVPLEVHFKVSNQGITLTDNTRTKFFRRHYPTKNISHFCMDPNNHFWSVPASDEGLHRSVKKSIFAFIARPLTGSKDNQCHIFCDLSSAQPASAIVSFAHKVLSLDNSSCKIL